MLLLSLQPLLPLEFRLILSPRTDPSPNRALTVCGWADPNPNSIVLLPVPAVCHQASPAAARSWVSATNGIQLPIRRMFGQSELWAQPGRSHQSQLPGRLNLALTDFSMMATVLDRPSDTD